MDKMLAVVGLVATALCLAGVRSLEAWGSGCDLGSVTLYQRLTNRTLVNPLNCGALLNASDFIRPPWIVYRDARPNENYTVMLIGTNQTTSPKTYYLYSLVANVKANQTFLLTDNATVLSDYEAPSAPKMGKINYTVLIYRQTPFSPPLWRKVMGFERAGFSPYRWLDEQLINQVRGPVAGAEFQLGASNRTVATPGLPPQRPQTHPHGPPVNVNGTTYVPKGSVQTQDPLFINGQHYVPVPSTQGTNPPHNPTQNHVSVSHVQNHKQKNTASKEIVNVFIIFLSLVVSKYLL